MYERVQLNTANRVLDWNGPFVDVEEACEEAADLAAEYREEGRIIADIDPFTFYVLDPAGREPIKVTIRPIA